MAHTRLQKIFADHPASVGESYAEHLWRAARFGARMVVSGFACLIHAVVPAAFTHAGSDSIDRLHRELTARRGRQSDAS